MKKFFSLILSTALILTLSLNTFAANNNALDALSEVNIPTENIISIKEA